MKIGNQNNDKNNPKLSPFRCLGIELNPATSGNFVGDCPFCGKSKHFFVSADTGMWDCKSCGRRGNTFNFLEEITVKSARETHPLHWKKLSIKRGLPPAAYQPSGIGLGDGIHGEEWWIPCFSDKGTVRDVLRYNGKTTMFTWGCHVQLWGLRELAKWLGQSKTVWVCEGVWDALALLWLLKLAGRIEDVVVAVPSAGIFKLEWVPWFRGHKVILCYDNDSSGDDGAAKAGEMLKRKCFSLKYLCWPESRPVGWDLHDFVKDGYGKLITPEDGLHLLEEMIKPTHRHAKPKGIVVKPTGVITSEPAPEPEVVPKTFDEVLNVFKEWVKTDQDLEDALAICLAVCLANDVPGEPLWIYLVGPPGSGKTVILMSLQDSDKVVYRSTLTPASLVSGFNVNPDPSLLPQLDGKTAIFKDGTELLALNADKRKEIYGVLRGAFDGRVNKSFGNGVNRDYILHFNMLIGVTPAIHGDSQAAMGERFLKYEIREEHGQAEVKMRRAIENIAHEQAMEKALGAACCGFLSSVTVDPTKLPEVPPEMVDRIIALALMVSMLRAQVEREQYGERDVKYRPSHEVGTRIAKQLTKLGQMLTFVYGDAEISPRIYDVLHQVARNTAIGYHLDLVQKLAEAGAPLTRDEVCDRAGIPNSTGLKRLQDLELLKVVRRIKPEVNGKVIVGMPPMRWAVTDDTLKLWNRTLGK